MAVAIAGAGLAGEPFRIVHRRFGDEVAFDERGVRLAFWGTTPVALPWSAVDAVAFTPSVEPDGDRYAFVRPPPALVAALPDMMADAGVVVVEIVFRGPLAARRRLGWRGPVVGRMLDADDVPVPGVGFVSLDLRLASLSAPPETLAARIASRARIEALVHEV